MADATHTSGPWQSMHDFDLAGELTIVGNVDGEVIDGHTHHSYTLVAEVYDNDHVSQDRSNARLIVAAVNSYDRHFGPNAIAAAEDDLLGQMVEAVEKLLTACADFKISGPEVRDARALLARVKLP